MNHARYASRARWVTDTTVGNAPPGMISFGSGDAYPEGLPDLGDLARVAASSFRQETLQYSGRAGLPELRAWVARHVGEEGVRATPDDVVIVNGAKHALDLVCRLFVDPGDTVIVTTPAYMSALDIFRTYEVQFLEVTQDAEGMRVDDLRDRLRARRNAGSPLPKLLYDVPEFHNPSGVTLSAPRRGALAQLAEEFGFLIVEDDPYRRIRFEGTAVPPIQSCAPPGVVVGIGTFSKLIAPGLRLGWVVATPDIAGRLGRLKSDGGSCPLTQRLIIEYARAGHMEPHLRDLTRTYHAHRDITMEALKRALPGARWSRPQGGYYLWVHLPDGVDADRFAAAAWRHGAEVLPASEFYATAGPATHIRLAYSHASPAEITEGVRRLGKALEEMR